MHSQPHILILKTVNELVLSQNFLNVGSKSSNHFPFEQASADSAHLSFAVQFVPPVRQSLWTCSHQGVERFPLLTPVLWVALFLVHPGRDRWFNDSMTTGRLLTVKIKHLIYCCAITAYIQACCEGLQRWNGDCKLSTQHGRKHETHLLFPWAGKRWDILKHTEQF